MFGVGKLIGGALKAVGLEKIAPFVSLAVNAFTGNWAGVAMDVAGLASRIAPNSGFAKALSTFAPIASSFMGGGAGGGLGSIGNLFSGGKLSSLVSNFKNITGALGAVGKGGGLLGNATKILNAFDAAKEFIDDAQTLRTQLQNAQRQFGLNSGI